MTVSQNTAQVDGSTAFSVQLIAYLMLAVFPAVAVGQREVTIPSEPSCPACRIELELVATLGSDADPVAFRYDSHVTVDQEGRFIIANTYNAGEIAIYDADGTYSHSFGRAGQGPGEFGSYVPAVRAAADGSVYVFERSRFTVLAPGGREFLRTQHLPRPVGDVVLLTGGQLVIHRPDLSGSELPLYHLLDPDGAVVRSFGVVGRSSRFSLDPYEVARDLSDDSDTTFWSSRMNRFRVERWHVDGHRMLSIDRDAEWFPAWSGTKPGEMFSEPPRPRGGAVWQDAHGRLWTFVLVPDRRWEPIGRDPRGDPSLAPGRLSITRVFDTVIEVIDVSARTVIVRRQLDSPINLVQGTAGMAYGMRETPSGLVAIEIWQLSLSDEQESTLQRRSK